MEEELIPEASESETAGSRYGHSSAPRLIDGGLHEDERGTLLHVNDFDFDGVDRFYAIQGREPGHVRGWVGHRRNTKWFTTLAGEALVAVVQPDDWSEPSQGLHVWRFVLSSRRPQVLHVPPGSATAMVHLTADALVVVFSSGDLGTAADDDYRFPASQWPVQVPESF